MTATNSGAPSGSEEAPSFHRHPKEAISRFTTPAGRATLGGTKDPDQTPFGLWRTRKGYAASSLAPGSFAITGSPNEAS